MRDIFDYTYTYLRAAKIATCNLLEMKFELAIIVIDICNVIMALQVLEFRSLLYVVNGCLDVHVIKFFYMSTHGCVQ